MPVVIVDPTPNDSEAQQNSALGQDMRRLIEDAKRCPVVFLLGLELFEDLYNLLEFPGLTLIQNMDLYLCVWRKPPNLMQNL